MTKIEKEKQTITLMVELYCKHKLHAKQMPEEYASFLEYAHKRLDHCRFGEKKTSCKRCPIHCYGKERREQARRIMRWSGPRMIFHAPVAAIKHMFGF